MPFHALWGIVFIVRTNCSLLSKIGGGGGGGGRQDKSFHNALVAVRKIYLLQGFKDSASTFNEEIFFSLK